MTQNQSPRYPWAESYLRKQRDRHLERRLSPVGNAGAGRVLVDGRPFLNFSGNDYLGLTRDPKVIARAREYTGRFGTGAAASRLMSGSLTIHTDLERRLAARHGGETALLFGSGFLLNSGVIPAAAGPNDAVFADRLVHASIIDGILASGADLIRFRHNDMDHLESLLRKRRSRYEKAWIAAESVYSMDGDRAPLEALISLKESHDAMLYLDEAHAVGVYGPGGAGLAAAGGLTPRVDLLVATFGKAFAAYGAYVVLPSLLREYLINRCRTLIFSTALPPSVIGTVDAVLDRLDRDTALRHAVTERADRLREGFRRYGAAPLGDTPIVPLPVGEEERALTLARRFRERGILTLAVRPPTVPAGAARLRFSVSAAHTDNDIDRVIEAWRG